MAVLAMIICAPDRIPAAGAALVSERDEIGAALGPAEYQCWPRFAGSATPIPSRTRGT